ncbi:MAG: leucyl aminopeptidase family protein, partial [Planctomycetales bacterium]|nr:leucyl aminopeptidase family protein [Planctomycetales bacterium]
AFCLNEEWSSELTEAAVAGVVTAYYGQDLYRHKKRLFPPDEMFWATKSPGLASGQMIGEAINYVRRLVNAGPHELHPESMATQISQMARIAGIEAEVWNPVRLKTENCHAMLAVAQGSVREPRLVILKYRGGGENAPTLGLVGKGVTFDSGGLSLKTAEGMKTMKCDMAGAATVAGTIRAIGQLRLPVNVIGIMGMVENMTGPAAYKLGDVITTRQGTTVEVLNTDAEGRLVLADCLDVVRTMGVDRIIDVATLTGACVVALGSDVAGMLTNNQDWCDQVRAGFEATGELAWQLPMHSVYDELIVSDVADIRNTGKSREAGAITAAKFLEHFVGEIPWTHLDIAGTAFRDTAKSWVDAGATGEGLRSLVEVARNFRVDDEPVVFQQD